MALKNPPVGPVLGLTTKESARFMAGIQNKLPKSKAKDKINCGWIRLKKSQSRRWGAPKRFRFNRNFYYTGVIEIRGLESATEYEYQLGFKSDYSETGEITASEWDRIDTYSFFTQGADQFHFCFGSCLRNGDDSRVGKALRFVSKKHTETPLDMMLWLGDQVYNDKYLLLTMDNSSKEDFYDLYDEFFSNEHVQKILPKLPNYMVMDDHEIANGLTDGVDKYRGSKWLNLITRNNQRIVNGINAFYSYQASHGGIYTTEPGDQKDVYFLNGVNQNQVPVKHYYELAMGSGDIGLFIMDTRKERSKGKLISKNQERAFYQFLSNESYRVKLVASSVTFLADKLDYYEDNDNEYEDLIQNEGDDVNADNWKKAARQRASILKYIDDNNVNNVLFLSGDVHSHFAARLIKNSSLTTVYQLVSGSLFWPTSCLINRIRWFKDDVAFGKQIYKASSSIDYRLSEALSDIDGKFHESNGVGYVSIGSDSFEFKVLNHKGEAVIKVELPLS